MIDIEISPVSSEDISAIVKLQDDLLIENANRPEDGFLVSGFTTKQYGEFIEQYEYFYKATIGNEVVGVLMAFTSDAINDNDSTNLMLKHIARKKITIIKQVFVSKDHGKLGIATKLYNYLFNNSDATYPYVAVIVSEPLNMASCKFHQKHGFIEYLNFVPKPDMGDVTRKRSAWIKLPGKDDELKKYVQLSNVVRNGDTLNMLISRSSQISDLYTHEDNLNWTKLGIQVTLTFALVAAFGYFYKKTLSPKTLTIIIPFIIWGFTINFIFYKKIKSGVKYLLWHKTNLKNIDHEIELHSNYYKPILPHNNDNGEVSQTVKLLPWVSIFGIVIWVIISLLLFSKAMGWSALIFNI